MEMANSFIFHRAMVVCNKAGHVIYPTTSNDVVPKRLTRRRRGHSGHLGSSQENELSL